MVNGQAAVRVTVIGDTEITTGLDDSGLQAFGVRRTGVAVDVASVRLGVDDRDIGTEFAEHRRPELVGGTIRAVDRDLHAAQIGACRLDQVRDVGFAGPRMVRIDLANTVAGGTFPLGVHERLDLVLDRVRQLVAAVREELDAVVGHGVVGCRDHDAQVHGVFRGRQVGDGRGGHDADARDVHAGAGKARSEGMIQEFPRNTRVTTDDRAGLGTIRAPITTELAGSGLAELQREVRGDVNVCQSSHAVRAEHSGHSVSVQWVI